MLHFVQLDTFLSALGANVSVFLSNVQPENASTVIAALVLLLAAHPILVIMANF